MLTWEYVKYAPSHIEISEEDDWYEFWNINLEDCYSECGKWLEMSYYKNNKMTYLFDVDSDEEW
jgi:predicted metal-binding protein